MPRLGCSTKVLALVGLLVILLFALSIAGGAIGTLFIKGSTPLDLIRIREPHIELPPETITHPILALGPLQFVLTNTMLAAWLTMAVLIVLSIVATRKMSLIPRGVQNLWETLIEKLLNFCTSVAGDKHGRRFFPVIATIFLYVITNAWLSLLPGFGAITIQGAEGEPVPLLRGANTDITVPLALALFSFFFVEYWGISTIGIGYLSKFFNVGKLLKGKLTGLIDVFVGILELLSEFIRLLSFTFRLFGNMTAGEILLLIGFFLIPLFTQIFYGLELLVGFIQALIFAGLTLVFATVAVISHHSEEHK